MTAPPQRVQARTNPRLAYLRRLQRDPGAYRRHAAEGAIWLEGEHLLRACLARGGRLRTVLVSASAWARPALRELAGQAAELLQLDDALFGEVSALQPAVAIGAFVDRPPPAAPRSDIDTLVLDRIQDAGNVGSMLRSAAALGVEQVIALVGTAALWSPKVLRAGMGAHFALALNEAVAADGLAALGLPLVATSSHAGVPLPDCPLPRPCAWLFGHEGQGIAPGLLAHCRVVARIPQPGGEESLNVAAAAAICLYEAARRRPASMNDER
jgi:TrmH family RNA methyltransferase